MSTIIFLGVILILTIIAGVVITILYKKGIIFKNTSIQPSSIQPSSIQSFTLKNYMTQYYANKLQASRIFRDVLSPSPSPNKFLDKYNTIISQGYQLFPEIPICPLGDNIVQTMAGVLGCMYIKFMLSNNIDLAAASLLLFFEIKTYPNDTITYNKDTDMITLTGGWIQWIDSTSTDSTKIVSFDSFKNKLQLLLQSITKVSNTTNILSACSSCTSMIANTQ